MSKKRFLAFIPISFLLILFLSSSTQAAAISFDFNDMLTGLFGVKKTEEFHKTLPLKAEGSFSLKNVNGSITIRTWKEEKVEIRATKTTKHDPKKLKEVKIEIESVQDSIQVNTVYPKLRNIRVSVNYEVSVPEGVNLGKIKSVNGDVTLSGPFGSVKASSTNGGVKLEGASGKITLSTTNGSLEASGVRGLLEAGTTNGSIFLGLDTLEDELKAKTVNGGITLRLQSKKIDADLEARTVNGKIHFDFPVTFKTIMKSRRSLEGQIGQGGVGISLRTVNGSIKIIREE
ncbi:MAG: DUF4097 family beta strand repeat protein [Candidatus Aminicenantes bacterium]|nr:DUF4097 family beta strand repeat protein [Candidatus Aminicenantes bacterium]